MVQYIVLNDQFAVVNNSVCLLTEPSLSVEDYVTHEGSRTVIRRTVTNRGMEEITFLPAVSVKTENPVSDWFVPSVSYSGNHFGNGNDPKGLTADGKPWIFSSDRQGIPGCTVVMGELGCSALFLPPECTSSASSLEIDGDTVTQRAFFTHIEAPKSYSQRSRYSDAVLETITLAPAESRTFTAYFFLSEEKGTFGYRPFIDHLLTEYAREPINRYFPEIYDYSMSFIRALVEKRDGMTLTNMGFLPYEKEDGSGLEFRYRHEGRYECGWCGQNITNAWLLLFDHMKKNGMTVDRTQAIAPFDMSFAVTGKVDLSAEDVQNALAILDTWQAQMLPSGLIPVVMDCVLIGMEEFTLDLCNLGWLAYQYINCYILLKNGGVVREDYLNTARRVLDAVLDYPAKGQGFPQTVNEKGKVVCAFGMAGTMMTVAALQIYRVTKEQKYLDAGVQSFDFYYDSYLSKNAAAGGALDTYCIDKESAGPVLRSALMLERITGDGAYLKKAENIACYLQTWMFYYDIPFPPETDAGMTGFTSLGATSVSAQHNHLDCWASYYAPDLRYLAKKTGDPMWARASDYIREYTMQGISDGKTEMHGLIRPAGAQNEGIFQSNWSFAGHNPKGMFNDWLVSWVNAFRLMDINHNELC